MIRLQGRVVLYGELWFDEEPAHSPGVDILVHRYHATPIAHARIIPLRTLRSDLTVPADAIAAAFDANCRRQIRHAGRDRLHYELCDAADERIEEFSAFYDAFAREKRLEVADRHWLSRVAADNRLTFSCVSCAGRPLVWHSQLRAGDTVQVTYSASLFRGMNADDRALVGRANRWLHWQNMLAFKNAGARCYDWGGMFADESSPEHAGVNRFKRGFGGVPVLAYECRLALTLRGRVWLTLQDVMKRRATRRPTDSCAPSTA